MICGPSPAISPSKIPKVTWRRKFLDAAAEGSPARSGTLLPEVGWAVNPWVKPVGPVVTVVLMSEISPRSWLTNRLTHNVLSIDSIAVLFENWTNPSTPVFLF